MVYQDLRNTQLFSIWSTSRECVQKADKANDWLERRADEINLSNEFHLSPAEMIKKFSESSIRLSFCFQPGDGAECSKPVGFADLKDGAPVVIYPHKSR